MKSPHLEIFNLEAYILSKTLYEAIRLVCEFASHDLDGRATPRHPVDLVRQNSIKVVKLFTAST